MAALPEFHAPKLVDEGGEEFAEQESGDHAESDPDGQISFEEIQTLCSSIHSSFFFGFHSRLSNPISAPLMIPSIATYPARSHWTTHSGRMRVKPRHPLAFACRSS